MPVKSIEQQIKDRGVLGNMPRFGKLRKGGEKPDGKIGPDLNHFRLTLEPEFEHIRDEFERLFTAEPVVLRNVMIAADSPDKALDYWYEEWAHARLVKRCDEETVIAHWDDQAANYSNQRHACTCNPLDRSCSLTGRLNIVIPALCEAVGQWGILTILTGSIYDVTALRASMHVTGAFMQRIQNVAFWSVPFEIGRVTRKVPVTINGKRSIKPMSLLYVQVEPDFNQKVLSPMLTAPSQLLLQGINPETGEMPEIVIEQQQTWDRDWVNAQTIHLFDHENHQMNAIDKMIADGDLNDDMTDETVIELITENRAVRKAEKASKNGAKNDKKGSKPSVVDDPAQSDLDWVKNAKRVGTFISKAQTDFNLSHGGVLNALRWTGGDNSMIKNIADFIGTPRDAWAACVAAYCDYSPEKVEQYQPDPDNPLRIQVLDMIQTLDIPF